MRDDIRDEVEKKVNLSKKTIVPNNRGTETSKVAAQPNEELIQIGPRLPKKLVDKLNVYAKLNRVKSQDVVCEALEKFLARKSIPGFD